MQLNMIDKITPHGYHVGCFAIIILTTTFQPLIGWPSWKGYVLGDYMYCAALALRMGRA